MDNEELAKSEEKQYVIFQLGTEAFALEINTVREIIVNQETTKIPGSSYLIEGIINLRGRIIPVLSLKRKFGFVETEIARSARIVVVEAHHSTVGIIVDGVSQVLMIPGNIVEKPSSMLSSDVEHSYIAGIANMDANLIMILDLGKVIDANLTKAV